MPKWTKSPIKPITVSIVLFDRFSNLCLANCLEPMRAANALAGQKIYDWQFLSPDGAPVHSSSGLPVMAQGSPTDLGALDRLFVVASYDHLHHDTRANRQMLRNAARKSTTVIGLDSGPWLMAAAGLLDGRRATVHWDLLDGFTETFHRVDVERLRVIRDGNRITCAGALSAMDMTLDMIREDLGEAMRLDIEAMFIRHDPPIQPDRTSQMPQPTPHGPLVARAMQLMRETVDAPLTLPQLAHVLAVQPRTLDRRFRGSLGTSPGQVYRHIRLSAARQMVEGSRLPVSEIALRTGYDSAAALTRAFRARFGVAPSGLRA